MGSQGQIVVSGAREHNLKDVSLAASSAKPATKNTSSDAIAIRRSSESCTTRPKSSGPSQLVPRWASSYTLKYSASRPRGTRWLNSERESAWVPPSTRPMSAASTKNGAGRPAGRENA
jgi:hypothetical protein